MRSRITWLVVGVSSAIIFAFIIPLSLLVRTMTYERAGALARGQAQSLAVIVASVDDDRRLRDVLEQPVAGIVQSWITFPDGSVITRAQVSEHHPDLVAQARSGAVAFSVRAANSVDALVPVVTTDGVAVVHSSVLFESVRRGLYSAWAAIGALGLLLLALAAVVAGRLSKRISTPLVDLAATAHMLRAGDMGSRARVDGPAEIAEVATAFNGLADRIDVLLGAERERATDLSHRLRTPVTALRMDAEMVADDEARHRLLAHVHTLHRAIDSVVLDARRTVRDGIVQPSDAARVMRERATHWGPLAEDEDRAMTVSVPSRPAPVPMAAQDLADVIDNLIDNVFAHTPDGAELGLSVERGSAEVVIAVEDGGPGLADQSLVRRGKSGSGSSGLGLAIVERLVQAAGGDVDFAASRLGGLRVTAVLPLVRGVRG